MFSHSVAHIHVILIVHVEKTAHIWYQNVLIAHITKMQFNICTDKIMFKKYFEVPTDFLGTK